MVLEVSVGHDDVHIAPVPDGRGAVAMDAVSIWRFVLAVFVDVVLYFGNQPHHLFKITEVRQSSRNKIN